jgi:hypothetical protein
MNTVLAVEKTNKQAWFLVYFADGTEKKYHGKAAVLPILSCCGIEGFEIPDTIGEKKDVDSNTRYEDGFNRTDDQLCGNLGQPGVYNGCQDSQGQSTDIYEWSDKVELRDTILAGGEEGIRALEEAYERTEQRDYERIAERKEEFEAECEELDEIVTKIAGICFRIGGLTGVSGVYRDDRHDYRDSLAPETIEVEVVEEVSPNFSEMNVRQLRDYCKVNKIEGYTAYVKQGKQALAAWLESL